DFYVSVPNLLSSAKQYSTGQSHLYMGYVRTGERPQRELFNRHYISLREYPFSRFPPFAAGGCFLLSNSTLHELYFGSFHLPKLPFDDVFLGMIAQLLNIPLQDNRNIYITEKIEYEPEKFRNLVA